MMLSYRCRNIDASDKQSFKTIKIYELQQIVIAKDPKQSMMEITLTLFVSRNKADDFRDTSQFCLNLLSNQISIFLDQPTAMSHTCFLMPQKYFTEVLDQWLTNN